MIYRIYKAYKVLVAVVTLVAVTIIAALVGLFLYWFLFAYMDTYYLYVLNIFSN